MLVGTALAAALVTAAAARPRWQQLSPPPAMPEPTARGDLAIDDFTLHWATYGDATATPVVLLHGGLGSGDDFAAQVPALAVSFRVIVVDSRGHGRSTRSKHGVGYHQMATDLIALLDHLGVERTAVVGWSDGGITALDVAIHHPDRITRLVVTGTNYNRAGTRAAARSAALSAYYARCVKQYRHLAPDPDQLAGLRADLRTMWKTQPAFSDAQLRAIAAPLLVVHGEHDELIRRDHAERLADLVPDASFAILPAVSHFAMWQDPDRFNRVVLAFLGAPSR